MHSSYLMILYFLQKKKKYGIKRNDKSFSSDTTVNWNVRDSSRNDFCSYDTSDTSDTSSASSQSTHY